MQVCEQSAKTSTIAGGDNRGWRRGAIAVASMLACPGLRQARVDPGVCLLSPLTPLVGYGAPRVYYFTSSFWCRSCSPLEMASLSPDEEQKYNNLGGGSGSRVCHSEMSRAWSLIFVGLFRQGCYRSTRFRFLLFTSFLSYLSFLLLMMFSGGRTLLKTRYYSFFSSFRALSSNNIDR